MQKSIDNLLSSTFKIKIVDDLVIRVPSDIKCKTTYILLEHEDWYDPAILFIRHLIESGMQILDVGAGYGVHAFSMAKQMSGKGRVIALEPAPGPSAMLNFAIEENGLGDLVTLIKIGLSNHDGESSICINAFGEVTQYRHEFPKKNIQVLTLDTFMYDSAWSSDLSNIDLIRIDAVLDASAVFAGGDKFFAHQDPLILLEIDAGAKLNQKLLESIKKHNLHLFYLVPALNALISIKQQSSKNDIDIRRTIFACKSSRAEQLRKRGLLL